MDKNEQYFHLEFYYPVKGINENANFRWKEPEAEQGSQKDKEALLICQKAETSVY